MDFDPGDDVKEEGRLSAEVLGNASNFSLFSGCEAKVS